MIASIKYSSLIAISSNTLGLIRYGETNLLHSAAFSSFKTIALPTKANITKSGEKPDWSIQNDCTNQQKFSGTVNATCEPRDHNPFFLLTFALRPRILKVTCVNGNTSNATSKYL